MRCRFCNGKAVAKGKCRKCYNRLYKRKNKKSIRKYNKKYFPRWYAVPENRERLIKTSSEWHRRHRK